MSSTPNSPPGVLSLQAAPHVWTLHLDAPQPFGECLSPDEHARAQRFYFERDRLRFVAARTALRRLLALYLETSSETLQFQYSKNGKPSLISPSENLRFNLSHADGYALLAFRRGGEIGVDIEKIRPEVETDKLAERFFSARERAQLCALPPDARIPAFFRCWTSKEALLKAWGVGLTLPLSSFDVEAGPDRPAALLATRPDASLVQHWHLYSLEAPSGFAATLAVEETCIPPLPFDFLEQEKLFR
jgi:4'-phosphopantetheinyl transferase